ncbi:MAG: sulfotransferase [Alphaproteobacteria bacterium]|nr:sulfotransferase [Alphaproteobacteria bacterium]
MNLAPTPTAPARALPPSAEPERYCMFFGYPRSGHTLIGSLLNAHPEVLISHELDALSRLREGLDREALFAEIRRCDEQFGDQGRQHTDYDYAVPGAWHGRTQAPRVIGDKKGGRSTWWLHDEPELLERLYEVVDMPVRFLHVSRSPWDNIATMVRRGISHDRAIAWYFETCDAVAGIKARIPAAQVFDLRHEDFVEDPRRWLLAMARFLEVSEDARWVEASASVVRPRPNHSRFELEWSEAQRAEVLAQIPRFPWLRPEDLRFEPSA